MLFGWPVSLLSEVMKAETELDRHRWWHHYISRVLGHWRFTAINRQTDEIGFATRNVRFCPLCREDYHEGAPVQAELNRSVGLPPMVSVVARAPENVVPISPPSEPV